MATSVIDALSITLGLDVKEYKKGQKEVADSEVKLREASKKTAQEMGEGQKKLTEGLTGFKAGLLEVIALFAAGIGFKDFVLGTMTSQAALGRLSTNLNMNARDLKAWGILAEEAGGKAEDAYTSLGNVQRGIAEAKVNGHSAFTDLALRMGFQITPEMIKTGNLQAIMGVIAKKLQAMPRDVALLEADQLGVGGVNNVLLDKDYLANLEHAKTLTGVTDESTKAAQRMQKSWVDFTEKMEGVKDRVWMKLEPVIERLGNQFARWVEGIDWDRLIDKVNAVADAFGGWKTIAIVLGGVLTLQVLSPVISLIGALTRLAPLLLSTQAGLLGMAAAGGAWVGTQIYKATAGTPVGDFFGKTAALGSAALGNKDAQGSLYDEYLNNLPPHVRDTILKARARAAGGTGGADPQKSHIYGSNAELFSSLESRFGLPSGILQRMFMQESGGGKHLLSAAGAKGPFQFMDKTAAQLGLQGNDVNDLDHAAAAAAKYLAQLKAQFGGDMQSAVAAYNWGPGNVGKKGLGNLPSETSNYLDNVLPSARQSARARSGSRTSTSEVHIASLQVNAPQARDADGIARGMQGAMQANPLLASSDTGME